MMMADDGDEMCGREVRARDMLDASKFVVNQKKCIQSSFKSRRNCEKEKKDNMWTQLI